MAGNETSKIQFREPLHARYVKILPEKCEDGDRCCMRVELYRAKGELWNFILLH